MPTRFDLPALSTNDYASLRDELTAAIPKYSDVWTDFNYSDPGITLLQLLCWLGDTTLYRIDTPPRELYLNFVRLLAGGTGEELDRLIEALEADVVRGARGQVVYLGDDPIPYDPERLALLRYLREVEKGAPANDTDLRIRATRYWSSPYRAVTATDFQTIVKLVSTGVPTTSPEYIVERVVVVPDGPALRIVPITAYPLIYNTFVDTPSDTSRTILVLKSPLATYSLNYLFYAYGILNDAITRFIMPRKLVGTATRVEQPAFNPLQVRVQIACSAHADANKVVNDAYDALTAFLSPLIGGRDRTGWPYGRKVTREDVMMAVGSVRGIDHSQPINVSIDPMPGLTVGEASMTMTTYLGYTAGTGLPLLWNTTIEAMTDTWSLEVGMHARVGIDTALPLAEA